MDKVELKGKYFPTNELQLFRQTKTNLAKALCDLVRRTEVVDWQISPTDKEQFSKQKPEGEVKYF